MCHGPGVGHVRSCSWCTDGGSMLSIPNRVVKTVVFQEGRAIWKECVPMSMDTVHFCQAEGGFVRVCVVGHGGEVGCANDFSLVCVPDHL